MSTEAVASRRAALTVKRLFDIVASSVILVVGSPVFILLALLVKISSPGPILFVQERAGKDQKRFRMYKFRSMRVRPKPTRTLVWTSEDKAAITRVGRFLRDYGFDELPQVINILKGDMSVIGPRPPLVEQVQFFTKEERRMFRMRPGVLSLAAIKGRRSLTMQERYRYHVEYVERWSLKLDLEILLKGLLVVLRRESAEEKLAG